MDLNVCSEKDGALARRFQPVFVSEPTVEDAISILRGLKMKYELHHKVHITDSAVVAAAVYAKRYITERRLPDCAVDLMDESASRLRMQLESKPDDILALERKLLTLRIEAEALKKEKDNASKERLDVLQKEMQKLEAEAEVLNGRWTEEKHKRRTYNLLKEQHETMKLELEQAIRQGDYNRAGELKHVRLPALEKQLADMNPDTTQGLLREAVTADDVAQVVARYTGIPVSRLLVGEREKLLQMESHLRQRVVGQERAVEAIANCIRISRAGLHAHTKPLGAFLFLGPSGVGKVGSTMRTRSDVPACPSARPFRCARRPLPQLSHCLLSPSRCLFVFFFSVVFRPSWPRLSPNSCSTIPMPWFASI